MKTSEILQSLDGEELSEALYRHVDRLEQDISLRPEEEEGAQRYGVEYHHWIEIVGAMTEGYPAYGDAVFWYGAFLNNLNIHGREMDASMAGLVAGLMIVKDCVELIEFRGDISTTASTTLKNLNGEALIQALYQHAERLTEGVDQEEDAEEAEVDESEDHHWLEIMGTLTEQYPGHEKVMSAYYELVKNMYETDEEIAGAMAGFTASLVIVKDCVELVELEELVTLSA